MTSTDRYCLEQPVSAPDGASPDGASATEGARRYGGGQKRVRQDGRPPVWGQEAI